MKQRADAELERDQQPGGPSRDPRQNWPTNLRSATSQAQPMLLGLLAAEAGHHAVGPDG
jgi:hypothetical protein